MFPLKVEYLPHYTYDDYVQWEGRWELLNGIPYAMAPAPEMYHQKLSTKLSSQFLTLLQNCNSCELYEAIDWKINDETVLQPDILIVCQPFVESKFLSKTPILIIEILSTSTSRYDLNTKFAIYEQVGVEYYWIVNPISKKASIYQLVEGKYQLIQELQRGIFDFNLDTCKHSIDIGAIW